jgi:hypothetical protein
MSCGSLTSSNRSMFLLGSNSKLILRKFYTEIRAIYFAANLFLPNSPRSSLQPNKTNRINKRMTSLPNAKSTLSIPIDTVTRPYTDATATLSVELEFEFHQCRWRTWCAFLLGVFFQEAAPFFVSSRHLQTNARETEDRARWSTARQRADLSPVFLALRVTPWVRVLSWHATATINSSFVLGDNGFGPKRLVYCSITSIAGMAATSWSTALACDVSGRKILAKRQGTYWRVLVHGFRANFLSGKIPHGTVSSSTRRDTLTLFDSDSCCACSSCCRAGPPSLSFLATLGGVGEQIVTIFFMSTHEDQWFCAKRYLILGSITSWMELLSPS